MLLYSVHRIIPLSIIFLLSPSDLLSHARSFESRCARIARNIKQASYDDALQECKELFETYYKSPELHALYGQAIAPSKPEDAISHFIIACQGAPDCIQYRVLLAQTLLTNNLTSAAEHEYTTLLSIEPNNPDALAGYAQLLYKNNKFEQAEHYLQRALEYKPSDTNLLLIYANTLNLQHKTKEALAVYRRAAELQPHSLAISCNIAYTLKKLGLTQEAIALYENIVKKNPSYVQANFALALAYLSNGDFEKGWPLYEWRRKSSEKKYWVPVDKPEWDGSNLAGRTIFLLSEQGLGDTFQFIRYAQVLKEQGATVIVAVQNPLQDLLKLCPYIDTIIPLKDARSYKNYDVYALLMSVPYLIKTTAETIPAPTVYLHTSAQLDTLWKETLAYDHNFKIGLCWQAELVRRDMQLRATAEDKSIDLALCAPLFALKNVSIYSLKKMDLVEQKTAITQNQLLSFSEDFDKSHGRFMDTASLIKNLDLVITVDTAIAHLAAGLGVPVWLILPEPADWRWGLHHTKSPWYASMRLFRQKTEGDWTSVITTVTEEIKQLLHFFKKQKDSSTLTAVTSVGDLIDKITILEIKKEKLIDPIKQEHVLAELDALCTSCRQHVTPSDELNNRALELRTVNEELWNIENSVREKEKEKEFDATFIELARSIYLKNNLRASLKRQINLLSNSNIVEEKSYI